MEFLRVAERGSMKRIAPSATRWRFMLIPAAVLGGLLPFQNCAEVSFEQESASLQSSLQYPQGEHPPAEPTPVPKSPAPTPPAPAGPFAWKTGAYGACEIPCGKGLQRRTVECRDESTNTKVADAHCAGAAKPAAQASCLVPNPSCKTWIRSAADFMNLKTGPGEYACVEDDIDFKGAVVDARFAAMLTTQTVDGCGHALKNLAFRTRGLFGEMRQSTVRRLAVVDADVNVKASVSATEVARFGVIADWIQGASLVEDVEIRTSRKFQVKMEGFATWCAGAIGLATGGTFRRIKLQAGEMDLQCYFAGGFAGRIFPQDSSVKASDIGLSWSRLSYLGSGYTLPGIGFNDGVFGGFVGRFFGYHTATDELSSIRVQGDIRIVDTYGIVGGVIGQLFQTVIEHPPLLHSLSYAGTIERLKPQGCGGLNPSVGGILGHFFPKPDTNVPVLIQQSSFTGTIRLHECLPGAYHQARTPAGYKINAGLGIGGANPPEDMIQLKNFSAVGNVLVEVPGYGVTTTSATPRYPVLWRFSP